MWKAGIARLLFKRDRAWIPHTRREPQNRDTSCRLHTIEGDGFEVRPPSRRSIFEAIGPLSSLTILVSIEVDRAKPRALGASFTPVSKR